MKFLRISIVMILLVCHFQALSSSNDLLELAQDMAQRTKGLKIKDYGLDFRENLNNLHRIEELNQMLAVFQSYELQLAKIDKKNVSKDLLFLYEQIQFEIEVKLIRFKLEKDFIIAGESIPSRFSELKDISGWYSLYLKKWVSDNISPDEVFTFGVQEVARIREEIRKIQNTLGFEGQDDKFAEHLKESRFFLLTEEEVQHKFIEIKLTVATRLPSLFHYTGSPNILIQKDPDSGSMRPPGFYYNNTFYYNFYGEPYNWRSMDWLFLHEASPGHHYQVTYPLEHPSPEFSQVFNWYSGFQEGWAAYTENLGSELGLYSNIYSQLGKWEWDIVRSARLVLDVGLNYKGWTKDQARSFWRQNIRGQEDVMERTIERILRWPVQVVTYKVGEKAIKELRAKEEKRYRFDPRDFHHELLKYGPMPLPALKKLPVFVE